VKIATVVLLIIINASTALCWTIDIKQSANVSASVIKLGDICSNEIPEKYSQIVLAGTNVPGKKISISRQQILRKLVMEKASANVRFSGNDFCTVTNVRNTLSNNEIQIVLAEQLKELLPKKLYGAPESTVEILSQLPELAAESKWHLVIDSAKILAPGRNIVRVRMISGHLTSRFSVTVNCHIWGEIASLKSASIKGQLVTEQMVNWVWEDLCYVDSSVVIGRESVVGMVTAKKLIESAIIREPDLKAFPLVHQGEPVEMIIERSGISISATGVARRDGARNQVVPVRSNIDGRIVSGRVIGPGQVAWRR
jgi:flagella basal body P-ring formation protein FlgA